jgi:hypothetical protein
MCNLCGITTNQDAIRRLFGVTLDSTGNLSLGAGSGFLQPGFQKTAGYSDGARSARRLSQLVFVFFRQIQQTPSRERVGIFGKAAAPVSLLLQKRSIHSCPQRNSQKIILA